MSSDRGASLQNAKNKWHKQLKEGGFLDATKDNEMTVPKIVSSFHTQEANAFRSGAWVIHGAMPLLALATSLF